MAKQNQKNKGFGVTPQSEDYSKWYNDVVYKAGLAEHSAVRGAMVIKPYGYALWENIQSKLDKMFKDTGHENAYFPLLIPKSFLSKEADHVEGFAKECAVVTHYRLKTGEDGGVIVDPDAKLEEELIIRPTSETIINDMYSKWIKSYRDLPVLINQWANVMRWEMRPRMFLRTTEFLWQEGHTCHATKEEAVEETEQMLDVYYDFSTKYAAMSPIKGIKSEAEKFAGAEVTYCIEPMMRDKKALQAGTSHFLGQNFAKAFDIKFQGKDNKQQHVWQTSWGVSTRLIGGIIMSHGDDKGLVLPPELAPYQVVIVPILRKDNKDEMLEICEKYRKEFVDKGIRVKVDKRENMSPGFKYNDWELKGVPTRLEIGPRDLENDQVTLARRDTLSKELISKDGVAEVIIDLLKEIQAGMLEKTTKFREDNTKIIGSYDELKDYYKGDSEPGFAICYWEGSPEDEKKLKDELKISHRCYPLNLDLEDIEGECILTGKKTKQRAVFGRAY